MKCVRLCVWRGCVLTIRPHTFGELSRDKKLWHPKKNRKHPKTVQNGRQRGVKSICVCKIDVKLGEGQEL